MVDRKNFPAGDTGRHMGATHEFAVGGGWLAAGVWGGCTCRSSARTVGPGGPSGQRLDGDVGQEDDIAGEADREEGRGAGEADLVAGGAGKWLELDDHWRSQLVISHLHPIPAF